MRTQSRPDRSCTYVVPIEKTAACPDHLRSLSEYLSSLGVFGCEVVVLDSSPAAILEDNRRVLRWVGHHVAVQQPFDIVRTAAGVASTDRIIVASEAIRYSAAEVRDVQALLDLHEVVEPQDYLDPFPWWGGIDAARILMCRGIDPRPDQAATFGFRRGVLRVMRGFDATAAADPSRRMAAFGAEVFSASDVFVRREAISFRAWLRERPREAADDFTVTRKSAFFFALIPAMLLLALFAGFYVALAAAGAVAFGSTALALRGRSGAAGFFPIHACLLAPLWVMERSISVYWALAWKLQQAAEPAHPALPERGRGAKVASGE